MKGCGRKLPWPILQPNSGICLGISDYNHENPSHSDLSSCPEYKSNFSATLSFSVKSRGIKLCAVADMPFVSGVPTA